MTNKNEMPKGLSGLGNLGNTCYINSCMQVLSHIPELNNYINLYLSTFELEENNYDVLFLKEWIDLHKLMWSKNCKISPNRFIKVIKIIAKNKGRDEFIGFNQCDVSEFLYFLLECFHDGLKLNNKELFDRMIVHVKENYHQEFVKYFVKQFEPSYSYIDFLFSIIYKIEIIDKESGQVLSKRYENCYTIDLALPDTELDSCLDSHFKDEVLEGDNQYYHEESETYKDVIKRTRIELLPNILIIQLKRWNFNLRKNQRIIHFDEEHIDVSKYRSNHLSGTNRTGNYELFGIVNHSGNIFGGHYTSCVKSQNSKWYDFNDTEIREHKGNIKSNKNYVLFYRLSEIK